MKKVSTNLLVFFTTIILSSNPAYSKTVYKLSNNKSKNLNYSDDGSVSTADAMQQIEKTLLLDNGLSEKERNSDITISRTENTTGEQTSAVDVVIIDPKDDKKLIAKEKLAYGSFLVGQYEVAVEIYKQILKSDPKNTYAKFALATCYHNLNQYKQAKTLYYELLRSNPANKDQIIGNLLSVIVEESPNDAIYLLSKLSAQNPRSSYILAQSAMAYDKIGRAEQAELLLTRAIALDPTQAEYQYNLAIIYDKKGDYDKAADMYQNVIRNYTLSDNLNQSIPIEQVKQRLDFVRSKI